MKYAYSLLFIFIMSIVTVTASAQNDSTAKKDSTTTKIDSAGKAVADTAAVAINVDTAVVSTPMNCYKQYVDYFTERGAKAVTDGMQPVVVAFKSKESCHCYMGRVQVTGGKIKAPVYVQTEGGEYKTFAELTPDKKMDPDFLAAVGEDLWSISNGMSVVFQTTDKEYGRMFFYKSVNKNKSSSKEAPSPADLLK